MAETSSRRIEERIAVEALLVVGLVALALVQVTLVPAPLGFPPALLLVIVICRVLVGSRMAQPDLEVTRALRWALYGGLALDIFAASPFGSHALALLLAATLIAALTRRLRVEGPLLPLLSVLVGALIYELTLALVYAATTARLDLAGYAVWLVLPSVLFALIPTLPIFALMRWMARDD